MAYQHGSRGAHAREEPVFLALSAKAEQGARFQRPSAHIFGSSVNRLKYEYMCLFVHEQLTPSKACSMLANLAFFIAL